jgi:enoyl-CoA hydratase/carnithine racemase
VYELLSYEKLADGILAITLNRPECLNAVNLALLEEIYSAAQAAADDPDVVVVIYRGAGRAFSVGRDFKQSAELQTQDPEGWFAWRKRYRDFGPQTWRHPKATIAQVQGYALGAGHNLAVGCDITIASEDARFGYPEARFGILHGEAHIWNWLMGPKKTKEYMFTGRNFGAREAYECGLINQVVPLEELEAAVLAMARDIVTIERNNPGYIRANKFQINARHLELMEYSSLNPARGEAMPYIVDYTLRAKQTQEEFYTQVANRGFHEAVDDMHRGYTTRD